MTAPSFDDLVELSQPEATVTTETNESTPESNGHAEWPKTVDSAPDGVKTVQEFADHIKALLVERLMNEGKTVYEAVAENSRVNTNSVYQYARRDKNPMPSVLVRTTNEDGTSGDPKIFIPVVEATEWWMNRPERGSGANLAEEDLDKLLYKAGKKADLVDRLETRQRTLAETLAKQVKLRDRYGERLAEAGKTWEEANAAFAAQAAKDAETESAESEISDNE